MVLTSWIILLISIAFLAHQVWDDFKTFPAFVEETASAKRRKYFRKMLIESSLKYGVAAIIGLAALSSLNGLIHYPDILDAARMETLSFIGSTHGELARIGWIAAAVFFIPLAATTVIPFIQKIEDLPKGGAVALMARNQKEARWGYVLSLNAGIVEEIAFRLLLPLALYYITGGFILSYLIATLMFGIGHAYQGIGGIIATTIIGLILTAIYVLTAQLWLVVLIHVLVDIRGLVILPIGLGLMTPGEATQTHPDAE